MNWNFCFLRRLFLLLFTLGCYSYKPEEKWTFTFPQSINAVRHSDVEIPCNFTAPANYGEEVRIVWFVYNIISYPIVYSEDSSQVIPEYRGRTSLTGNGTNGCSLRITGVTKTEKYYPGISDKINSYTLNDEEAKKSIQVKVPGCSEDASCKNWEFTFPRSIKVLKGSCVEIPCKLKYPDNAQNFTLFWYKNALLGYPKIFNSRSSTDVEEKYKGRTFLVGKKIDNCSIRINDVQESVEIYPGINENINSYNLHNGKICRVFVIEALPPPVITGTEQMDENVPVNIICSINHTCASSPPSITWNNHGLDFTISHEYLDEGIWRINSTAQYIPSWKDDKTQLKCKVTFPNNKTSTQFAPLNIKYEPKNVTISVVKNIQPKEDNNVTLECTSQANPPVTKYTWYEVGKTNTLTGTRKQITVQNVTSEKYICSASNDIGTRNSSEFSFLIPYAAKNENILKEENNILIIGVTTGLMALALIVLVIILMRSQRTSVPIEEKKTHQNEKVTEQITMDNLLYEKFDGTPEQNSPRARNYHLGHNDDGEVGNSCQYKIENDQSVVYTSVKLLPANQIPRASSNTEETEYAQLNI